MKYLGGKFRIAKPLAAYLSGRRNGRLFVEPFCGALNVTVEMSGERIACDASPYLFSLYSALCVGWDPPSDLSEEQYKELKAKKDPSNPLTAFAGYGCSFGGVFFSTFARGGEGRNYAANTRNSLRKKFKRCAGVTFACSDYSKLAPEDCLVYCDPPYANTAGYAAVGAFDSAAFWQRVREWSATNTVLVSEYTAPPDFKAVWEIETKTDMHGEGRNGRMEKLFEWAGA